MGSGASRKNSASQIIPAESSTSNTATPQRHRKLDPLPPLHSELQAKMDGIPGLLERLGAESDVGSEVVSAHLEALDYFSSLPPSPPSLRAAWIHALENGGLVRQWTRLWEAFWAEEGFLTDGSGHCARLCLNFTLYLRILWTALEISTTLAEELISDGLVTCIASRIYYPAFESFPTSLKLRYVLSSFLSILLNCLRQNYGPTNQILRTRIAEETRKMLELLSAAVASSDGRAGGFTVSDLLAVLIRIAVYDANNRVIVKNGGIGVIFAAMRAQAAEAQVVEATQTLWQVAFLDDNRKLIKSQPEILETLNRLKDHRNKSIGDTAQGALWTISRAVVKFKRRSRVRLGDENASKGKKLSSLCQLAWRKLSHRGHVMLSYSHDFKHIVHPLNDALKAAGYVTWLDVEHVSGSVLESMASGVEAASVILVCLSDSYKNSPSCRTEAEYLFRIKKPFIPLRMQADFVADGWLGALVGNQLYFDCPSVGEMRSVLPKLIREMNTRLSDRPAESSSDEEEQSGVAGMRRAEVGEWLVSQGGLPWDVVSGQLGAMEGRELAALARLHARAPSAFFSVLKSELRLPFQQILALSAALEELK